MRRALAGLAVLVAASAPAATHDRDVAALLAGRTAGMPQTCVDPQFIGNAQIVDDRTLLYRQNNRRWWRNDLPDACPGLDDDAILVTEIHGGQLCDGDRVHSVSRLGGIPGPSCRLGKFVPYDKPR